MNFIITIKQKVYKTKESVCNTLCFDVVVMGIADSQTYGAVSLLDLGFSLIPTSVPIGTLAEHSAQLHTSQYKKMTFIYEGSNMYYGSNTCTGSYYFEDYIKEDYYSTTQVNRNTLKFFRMPNYDSPDVIAYQSYLSSPWYESPNKSYTIVNGNNMLNF